MLTFFFCTEEMGGGLSEAGSSGEPTGALESLVKMRRTNSE